MTQQKKAEVALQLCQVLQQEAPDYTRHHLNAFVALSVEPLSAPPRMTARGTHRYRFIITESGSWIQRERSSIKVERKQYCNGWLHNPGPIPFMP